MLLLGRDTVLFWAQVVGLFISLVALGVAVFQVGAARAEAKQARAEALKERRIDFELTVLLKLLVAVTRRDALRVRALASPLPDTVVPITRAAVQLSTTSNAEHIVKALSVPEGAHPSTYLDRLQDRLTRELLQAIDTRAHERGSG